MTRSSRAAGGRIGRTAAAGDIAEAVLTATRDLSAAVDRCRFPEPVAHVYNPLAYTWPLHEQYVRCGIRDRDDTGYMRTVDPSFELASPRW